MTPVEWIALLTAFFQFPKEILAIVKLLQKTPEEKRQQIIEGAQKVADSFSETGRPKWD